MMGEAVYPDLRVVELVHVAQKCTRAGGQVSTLEKAMPGSSRNMRHRQHLELSETGGAGD